MRMPDSAHPARRDWVRLRRDPDTGIESVHAHFRGHAYDPHDHDEALVGVTQQGVQRFRCHRAVHQSTAGRVMLIEPGAVHDGHAPDEVGFTYAMLYLPQAWLAAAAARLGLPAGAAIGAAFKRTVAADDALRDTIQRAFAALHGGEARLAREQSLDDLLLRLSAHAGVCAAAEAPGPLQRVRELLHERMAEDLGLDELARASGIDRFRLTREFKRAFGQSPHAYLVRLRLRAARALLAAGGEPGAVALAVGFADQSHLGRWFQRAYRLSPGAYRRQCTNVLDRADAPAGA